VIVDTKPTPKDGIVQSVDGDLVYVTYSNDPTHHPTPRKLVHRKLSFSKAAIHTPTETSVKSVQGGDNAKKATPMSKQAEGLEKEKSATKSSSGSTMTITSGTTTTSSQSDTASLSGNSSGCTSHSSVKLNVGGTSGGSGTATQQVFPGQGYTLSASSKGSNESSQNLKTVTTM